MNTITAINNFTSHTLLTPYSRFKSFVGLLLMAFGMSKFGFFMSSSLQIDSKRLNTAYKNKMKKLYMAYTITNLTLATKVHFTNRIHELKLNIRSKPHHSYCERSTLCPNNIELTIITITNRDHNMAYPTSDAN